MLAIGHGKVGPAQLRAFGAYAYSVPRVTTGLILEKNGGRRCRSRPKRVDSAGRFEEVGATSSRDICQPCRQETCQNCSELNFSLLWDDLFIFTDPETLSSILTPLS